MWHKILEEENAAQVKEKSLLVHLLSSKRTREKLQVTEIHRRFGDNEAILSFQKRRSDPLENVKELIFVTLFLPEKVSDQEVRLAFWEW